ncbi:PspC domain-containing protein [Moraxella haemolytica]|uniref:PspC domain-containing protein n=1 Tax=Moraxella TaxID=475 RepID=UPI0025432BF7|nr:PspC domain-containing protein [Moraxella sp. ZY171148]WII95421.1 PspC domain-containing protein [Moraxella sp. ZY171148]
MAQLIKSHRLHRLHRSKKNRLLAGVLGGLAEYLGWKPTHIRLLFWAIIIFSAGVTLPMATLTYLLMWLVMPEATASSYAIEHQPY